MVAISTFEVTFPGAESKGCLFHFARCAIRKVAQLGLRRLVMPHWTTFLKGQMPMTGTPRLAQLSRSLVLTSSASSSFRQDRWRFGTTSRMKTTCAPQITLKGGTAR
ncbi:unnamed protein product [Ixodes persulcatus]